MMTDKEPVIKALVFDVFGTVVDWRSSVIGELKGAEKRFGIQEGMSERVVMAAIEPLSLDVNVASIPGATDWARFAQLWRNGYIQTT